MCLLDKRTGSDDLGNLSGNACRLDSIGARRVIEHCGYSLDGREAEYQAERGSRVWRHYADDFIYLRLRPQDARQRKRHLENRAVRLLLHPDVLDQPIVGTEGLLRVEERFEQCALRA